LKLAPWKSAFPSKWVEEKIAILTGKLASEKSTSPLNLAPLKKARPWKLAVLNDASWKLALMKFTSF
jgi:hypothetical protein